MTIWGFKLCLSAGLLFTLLVAEECNLGPCFCQDETACQDHNEHCEYWASVGNCEDEKYRSYMLSNCQMSCKQCKATDETACQDHNEHCEYWASVGNCEDETHRSYMLSNCQMSCKQCKATGERAVVWREQILKDVTHECCSFPGRLLVFGVNAYPILTWDASVHMVGIAAAQLGQGRLIVFAHDQRWMIDGNPDTEDRQQLGKNLAGWLLKDTSITSVSRSETKDISDPTELDSEDLKKFKILFWIGPSVKSAEFVETVKEYVENGGALYLGLNSWHYQYNLNDPTFSQLSMNKLMVQAGITFTSGNAWNTNNEVAKNVAARAHVKEILSDLVTEIVQGEGQNLGPLRDMAQQLKRNAGNFQNCIIPAFRAIFSSLKTSSSVIVPDSENTPVEKIDRLLVVLNEIIHRYSEEDEGVLPGLEKFPGIFAKDPETTSITVDITSPLDDYYATGYYAPPGQKVTVEVLSRLPSDSRWSMWIGSHTDDITDRRDDYRRYPHIHERTGDLPDGLTEIRNIFGGLIYFHGKEKTKTVLKVKLTGVIEAPYINTQDPASVADFERRKNAPGLWADIVGEYVTITVPSSWVWELDAVKIVKVMGHWDEVMVEYHHLRGSNIRKSRRQWIVLDITSAFGYMHTGYPIVGGVLHTILKGPRDTGKETLDVELLLQQGSWGWYHELGHNMQEGWWTFDNQLEITVNIFTRYAYYQVHGNYTLEIPSREGSYSSGIAYLKKPCTDPYTTHDAWAGLSTHIQLTDAFGWDAYKKIFRQYYTLAHEDLPKNNQEKIDQWVERLSKVVGFNLVPFYRFWCFPVSQKVEDNVKELIPWFPDDQMTRAVPEKTTVTLALYPTFDRVGGRVDKTFPKTLDPVAAPHPWVKVTVG